MVSFSRVARFPVKFIGDGGTLYDDMARIYVRGGKGGRGGQLYGGIGGQGGDVYLKSKAKYSLTSFLRANEKMKFIGGRGENSTKLFVLGQKGADLVIDVPMGITIENQCRKLLGELIHPDEKILVAKGGEGGSAKDGFVGQNGEVNNLFLHLKLLADIGFVGFPNAGKSTLLKALSRTDPRISAVPFTTVRPQIGTIVYDDFRRITLADLPGLIEGAHLNMGMGHTFLKHVERTMLLMFVVDLNGFQLSLNDKFRNAYETVLLLNKELELYDPRLLDKPAILCVNKMDTDINGYKFKKLIEKLKNGLDNYPLTELQIRPNKIINFLDILPISAKTRESTELLKEKLRSYLDLIDNMKRNVNRTEISKKDLEIDDLLDDTTNQRKLLI